MTAERVARMAAGGEAETIELKRTTGTRREAAMTVRGCSSGRAETCCSVSRPKVRRLPGA